MWHHREAFRGCSEPAAPITPPVAFPVAVAPVIYSRHCRESRADQGGSDSGDTRDRFGETSKAFVVQATGGSNPSITAGESR